MMKCPCCETELVFDNMRRVQTLDEHVFRPNDMPCEKPTYHCPNENCAVNNGPSKQFNIFWDEFGGLYFDCDTSTTLAFQADKGYLNVIPWIDGNDGPFGSIERKINVEVGKKDENKVLFIVPQWFPFCKGWQCKKRYSYQSNTDGDILKRYWKFEWIKADGVYYMSGLKMVLRSLRNSKNVISSVTQENKDYWISHLREEIERKEWKNAEWWRHVNAFIASMTIRIINLCY